MIFGKKLFLSSKTILHSFMVFLLWTSVAFAGELTGQVVGVHDGDTLTLLSEGNVTRKIRLAQIDAPELDQPYGAKSKTLLSDLVYRKVVSVTTEGHDRYNRIIGVVYLNGVNINSEMIAQGAAWYYFKYANNPNLAVLEKRARSMRVGLWALQEDQILEPWLFRKKDRSLLMPSTSGGRRDVVRKCGEKRYCKDMSSCDEAMFYLKECGLLRLDGGQDGMPCEVLCR